MTIQRSMQPAIEDWGLAAAPTTQTVTVNLATEGTTQPIEPAAAGSTLVVNLNPLYVDADVSFTGGLVVDAAGNANVQKCIQVPTTSCPNGQSSIRVTLDGTPGTVVVTPMIAPFGATSPGQAPDAQPPVTIKIPGTAAGKTYVFSPGGGALPAIPPGVPAASGSAPVATAATGSGSAAPATPPATPPSSTGTIVAVVAGAAVLGGGAWWWSKRRSGR